MKGMFLLLSAVFMIGGLRPASAAYRSAPLPAGDDAKIVRVVNADTIEVTINKIGFTLGLIGLDAPNKGECYEPQATAAVRKLLRGQTMRVVRDQSDFDANGRLMRYAYLTDGQFLNETIVKSGYARNVNSPPDQQQASLLQQAQQAAQAAKAGLWKACNALSQAAAVANVTNNQNQSNCPEYKVWLLDAPGPNPSEFDTLASGSCITLTLGGASGQYTWFPKDSKLKLSNNFIAHWDGQAISVYKNPKGEYISDSFEIRPDPQWPQLKSAVQTVRGLVYDGPYVRLQNGPNLFLNHGDDNMTALVDIAQRVSGSTFTKRVFISNLFRWEIVE